MRSILEQAVIHHLNGDSDKAADLFHQFVVAKARQIHESMRNGEEVEECDDEAVSETYFGEEDLAELENNDGDEVEGDGDEFAAADDAAPAFGGEEEGDDLGDFGGEEGDDLGGDDLGGEEDFEDKLEELQAELERLTAEFEELKGEEGAEGDDTDLAGELDDDMGGDDVAPADFGGGEEEEDDQAFDAFAESFTSELKKVAGQWPDQKADGKGIAAGGASNITHNSKSPGLQKGVQARQGGDPDFMSRQSQHTGFNRETPPSTGDLTAGMKEKPRNSHKQASLSPVGQNWPDQKTDGKEVGKGGTVKQNTKSPTSGVGRKGK